MNFKQQLINNVIEPSQSSKLSAAIGQVVKYDPTNNVANVFIKNISGKQNYTIKDVPIQIPGAGIHSSPVSYGSKVYIQFNNNSIFQAKIIGFADENYKINTREKERHTRKGTFIEMQKELTEEVNPSYKRWVDNNSDVTKYSNYRYKSPIRNISFQENNKGYFVNREVGLYNPVSSAIVKIKDSGEIDIFTATNVGVRINPKSKTIEMFGDTTTKSKNWSVLSNNIEVTSNNISIESESIDIKSNKITLNGELL